MPFSGYKIWNNYQMQKHFQFGQPKTLMELVRSVTDRIDNGEKLSKISNELKKYSSKDQEKAKGKARSVYESICWRYTDNQISARYGTNNLAFSEIGLLAGYKNPGEARGAFAERIAIQVADDLAKQPIRGSKSSR